MVRRLVNPDIVCGSYASNSQTPTGTCTNIYGKIIFTFPYFVQFSKTKSKNVNIKRVVKKHTSQRGRV